MQTSGAEAEPEQRHRGRSGLALVAVLTAALVAIGVAPPGSAPLVALQAAPTPPNCPDFTRPTWMMDPADPGASRARAWTTASRERSIHLDGQCLRRLQVGGWVRSEFATMLSDRPAGLAAPSRGLVVSGLAGVRWATERMEIRVAPFLAWHANRDIEVPLNEPPGDFSPFSYPFLDTRIDWPARHGEDAFTLIGPGESGVRVRFSRLSAGLDARSFSWGAGRRYPLLLSGHGPSIPRLDLRTDRPFDLGTAGSLDLHLLWGLLDESDWFDTDPGNDRRIMTGLSAAWMIGPLPGLEIGLAALRHRRAADFEAGDVLGFLQTPVEDAQGNAPGNGLGQLWLRWTSRDGRIQAWADWAKDDYSDSFTDLLLEPEHNSARTLGFRYLVARSGSTLSLHLESVTTELADPAFESAGKAIFYTHFDVRQGHTNRGQMLGAFVGPGASGQFLEIARIGASTSAVQIERIRWNEDVYVRQFGDELGTGGHDVEMVGRLIHERPMGRLRARGELEVGARHNRYFLQDDPSWESNGRLTLLLIWGR